MKHIYLTHALSMKPEAVLFSYPDFNTPNLTLPAMQRALTPDNEIYITVNNFFESNDFMIENTLIETIRREETADGFIIDQIFTRDFHDVDTVLLETLSNEIRNRHFIVGPSFTKVPYFLHSRLAELFIDHDVSGVMYDLRDIDIRNFKELQPLAKLKMHVKKRLQIIPLVRPEQLGDLKKSIPLDVAVIDG
ncbi:hypothetical protein BN1048_01073 [Jeotgalicoccus saudimassiliensis]|uniref:Uncharacterized protein n=1 Tax=Jeotgalicoccus saudimassiliensis TaxID=1461582 RepID=A0A078M7Y3_9STAP|nr:hypothetical protein [Jeotgalicoccus saudimassiliensis]CEA00761.1 hypothetical protein BN1048_01073 [Jeotgalicoccus saudimassiliensis]